MFGILLAQAERRHLSRVGRFDRLARREARSRARAGAEDEALRLLIAGVEERAARQAAADQAWTALMSGDPTAVADAVGGALEARGLDVDVSSTQVGQVRIDLAVSGSDVVPTHQPALTPGGTPTLKKLTKTEVSLHVRHHVAALVLLAAKEALAQSPAIGAVEVSARRGGDALLRTHLERGAMNAAPWRLSAWDVLEAVDPELESNIGGRTQELRPLQ